MTNQHPQQLKMSQQPQVGSSPPINIVDRPTSVDVLCGRGKMCFHHVGDVSFRMLIAEHADTYKMAPTKKAKMQVVMLIVEIVTSRGGRFLLISNKNDDGTWIDGGYKQGKKKTGHAFRDALRGRVKCITQMRVQLKAQNTKLRHKAPAADDSSFYSSVSGSSNDEFELDHNHQNSELLNETQAIIDFSVEPNAEWRKNSKIDAAMADDLLDFFMISEKL
jgi:hypothetical protein